MIGKLHKEHIKKRSGEELLDKYQELEDENMIEIYQQALIEKYAKEIGYNEINKGE